MIFSVAILSFLFISSYSSERVLPHAIIIGVKKSGTRALLKFLSTHSGVSASPQEIHFFDLNENFQRGLPWYRNQMPTSEVNRTLTIEKTPHYFITKSAPRRLVRSLPDVKLLLILRDPITRAISDYVQLTNRHETYPTFDHFISHSNFTRWTPIAIGCYARYLRRWLKYFPLEQIHFVDGENLIQRPWEELAHVQRFLNLSMDLQREDFYFNSAKLGFPCLRQRNGCLGRDKGRPHPIIRNQTREKLQEFYATCNAHLKRLARIDFPWI